jgi:hypothetical protein
MKWFPTPLVWVHLTLPRSELKFLFEGLTIAHGHSPEIREKRKDHSFCIRRVCVVYHLSMKQQEFTNHTPGTRNPHLVDEHCVQVIQYARNV